MTATFAMKSFNPEAPGFTEMARAGVPDFIACDGRCALLSGLTSVLGGIGLLSHISLLSYIRERQAYREVLARPGGIQINRNWPFEKSPIAKLELNVNFP